MKKGKDPDPYLWLMDPDPEDPKTFGSGSVPLTNGSRSRRPKNFQLRIFNTGTYNKPLPVRYLVESDHRTLNPTKWCGSGKQCCGSRMFIPDPNFFHPWPRIRIKEFKYFKFLTPKNISKLSEIWSGLFILDPDTDFFIHPGSRIQGSKRQ